jgi:hypothetical protein
MHATGLLRLPLWLALTLPLLGCGAEVYERRLNETKQYFNYLDTVNAGLAPQAWQGDGITLRVPRQFVLIPPPAPKPKDAPPKSLGDEPAETPAPAETAANADAVNTEIVETPPEEPVDPRQPDYLELELPGLIAAWQADVRTETPEGVAEHAAYLYLMSNGSLWAEGKSEEAAEFHKDVVQRLVEALGTPILEKDWTEERLPTGPDYVERKAFTATRLVPEEPIDGTQMEFSIYLYQKGDTQLALLLVVPRNIDRQEQIDERVKLMLENMAVTGSRPQGPATGGAAAEPAAPVGGGF